MHLTVLDPGAFTLVQDQGRAGQAHLGVPGSGAYDPHSLTLANRLVGNSTQAAGLEIAATGPALRLNDTRHVALTGADADLYLDGQRQSHSHTVLAHAGQIIHVSAPRHGLRTYLAVSGGIATPTVLGSRSTCTLSRLGPLPLTAGARLPLHPFSTAEVRKAARPLSLPSLIACRVLPGPHAGRLHDDALTSQDWIVSAHSSRIGIRLTGTALAHDPISLASAGTVLGAVQLPPSGEPIVLGPDHGTTGGYPVVATVLQVDLHLLAQASAGDSLRLIAVNADEAHAANRPPATVHDLSALSGT